jgi:hypothetical protein
MSSRPPRCRSPTSRSFDAADLYGVVALGPGAPAVDRACTLLDITCRVGTADAFRVVSSAAGAMVIAGVFEKAIGLQLASMSLWVQ